MKLTNLSYESAGTFRQDPIDSKENNSNLLLCNQDLNTNVKSKSTKLHKFIKNQTNEPIKIIYTEPAPENYHALLESLTQSTTPSSKENFKHPFAKQKTFKTMHPNSKTNMTKFLNPKNKNMRNANFSCKSSGRSSNIDEIELNLTNCSKLEVNDLKKQYERAVSRKEFREQKLKAEITEYALLSKVQKLQNELEKTSKEKEQFHKEKEAWTEKEKIMQEAQEALLLQIKKLNEGIMSLKNQLIV